MRPRFPFPAVAFAVLAVVASSPQSTGQTPLGAEFCVDGGAGGTAYEIFSNSPPPRAVAVTPDGDFLAAWTVLRPGNNFDYDIFARLFGGDGRPRGPQFQVNTYTTGRQYGATVALQDSGEFLITWASWLNSTRTAFARRLAASGAPIGSDFVVGGSDAQHPAMTPTAGGEFVVVWDWVSGGGSNVIYGQRHDATGARVGAEFTVYGSGGTNSPATVDRDANGDIVVAWTSGFVNATRPMARRLTAIGTPLGAAFDVAPGPITGGGRVARAANGSFVVAWSSPDGDNFGVFARRYDAGGLPIGVELAVNTYTTNRQWQPDVDADADGNFIVTWTSGAQDGSSDGVYGRRYSVTGGAGPEFRVNTSTAGAQHTASVASNAAGNSVALWYSVPSSAGTVWARRYVAGLAPVALEVDSASGPASNGNGVLEAGEIVDVSPSWLNGGVAAQAFTGVASAFTGPGTPGDPTYAVADGIATYGTVAPTATGTCATGGDCYALGVTVPTARPAAHWDTTFHEDIAPATLRASKNWTLHVGDSFTDVPRSSGFYRFVEALLHHGITGGCGGPQYCPGASVTRGQMAVFVLAAKEGSGFAPPACTTPVFADVPASSPFCPWIEELARRAVVGGCGGGNYCPSDTVTREQMAVFVLRTLDPAFVPPACVPPNIYNDVPETSGFCPWIEELTNRNVVAGCGGGSYCPAAAVAREQMGVFISVTFGLRLYGP